MEREVQQNVTNILSSITGTIRSEADNCEIDLELVAQVRYDTVPSRLCQYGLGIASHGASI